ncbi:odorant receptor 22c-like [Cylas formicarius]|uniref:odorant receptor 22c-like n=1 Tax=Cylas formicarius TaxID=197179 RepID=UPI00295831FF|nr:odorant receptor 22c-like [Cylas formicarius]
MTDNANKLKPAETLESIVKQNRNIDNPDLVHMSFVKRTMLIIGIWPANFRFIIIYNLYFYTSFLYYILYNMTLMIQVFATWNQDMINAAGNAAVAIIYILNIYRVVIFRSLRFRALIHQTEMKERQILTCSSDTIKGIFTKNVAFTRRLVRIYVAIGTTGISLYYASPLVEDALLPLPFDNSTGVQPRRLIFSSWFPFNPNLHYWTSYFLQFVAGFYGYSYIVHCGAFYITMLTFVTAQLKILRHLFANFTAYCDEYSKTHNFSDEENRNIVLKALIREHQHVIRFVWEMNDCMKLFTMMDFIISSFQLSLVLIQVLGSSKITERFAAFSYFLTLNTQLLFLYWNAHEITVQSEKIAVSVFAGDFYNYPGNVTKMLQMVIIRAQKPLVLTIGPMGHVKMDAVFQIFRALYSYICLILRH